MAESPASVDLHPDLATRVDLAVERMWASYRSGVFWASAELWLASRHSEELRRSLLPSEREIGAALARSLPRHFGEELAGHPRYAELMDLLNTSMRGVAVTYAFAGRDPAADPHLGLWQRLAREVLLGEARR
jgi:hypothetical protein